MYEYKEVTFKHSDLNYFNYNNIHEKITQF